MKTDSIGKSFTKVKIDFRIFIFHERLQKVCHEYLSVVYTMKLSWNTHFMKCSERNISQCILAFRKIILISKFVSHNLVNKQWQYTYCPISQEVKAIRQWNLVSYRIQCEKHFFLKNHTQIVAKNLFPDSFLKNQNWVYL